MCILDDSIEDYVRQKNIDISQLRTNDKINDNGIENRVSLNIMHDHNAN